MKIYLKHANVVSLFNDYIHHFYLIIIMWELCNGLVSPYSKKYFKILFFYKTNE